MTDDSLAYPAHPSGDTCTKQCGYCGGTGEHEMFVSYDPRSGELVREIVSCVLCGGEGRIETIVYRSRR